MQNARAANMPKDKIENAIKKASGQGAENYDIVLYEGYAPHGVAIIVETATNNVVRTVANVRSAFKTYGGSLGAEGSVAFQFKRMGVFRVAPEAHGGQGPRKRWSWTSSTTAWRRWAKAPTTRASPRPSSAAPSPTSASCRRPSRRSGIAVQSAESEYVAQNLVTLPEDKATQVLELVDALEQDDDVQRVFHNLG